MAQSEVGILYVRGPHLMRGYWNQPEKTAEVLVLGPLPGEFLLKTGDLFRRMWTVIFIVARSDEIIKSRGEKVSPTEVENAIYSLPAVRKRWWPVSLTLCSGSGMRFCGLTRRRRSGPTTDQARVQRAVGKPYGTQTCRFSTRATSYCQRQTVPQAGSGTVHCPVRQIGLIHYREDRYVLRFCCRACSRRSCRSRQDRRTPA